MGDFPVPKFRLLYPQFETVSDELLEAVAEEALCFITTCGGSCNESMWMLVVAHMLQLRFDAEDGGVAPGALASATVDKVSVSFSAPTSASAWSHWLNLTPFGQQFSVLHNRCNVGGRYAGQFPERAAFRNVGGRFPRRGRV